MARLMHGWLVVAVLVCGALSAAEQLRTTDLAHLGGLADEYLAAHSSPAADSEWRDKFAKRMRQAMTDNDDATENAVVNASLLDWLAGKKVEKMTVADRVQACRYFALYVARRLELPEQILKRVQLDEIEAALGEAGYSLKKAKP
jgi:hypothetical protein